MNVCGHMWELECVGEHVEVAVWTSRRVWLYVWFVCRCECECMNEYG